MQEEIKITGVTVFVNPYSEPDEEEEEEKAKDEKNAEDEDKVSFWILLTFYYLLFQILVLPKYYLFYVSLHFRIRLGHGIAIQVQEHKLELLVVEGLEST